LLSDLQLQILFSQTIDMKIRTVSLVKKLGLLNQRDKQIVRDNIQQNILGRKLCSIKSTYTIVESFIE